LRARGYFVFGARRTQTYNSASLWPEPSEQDDRNA